MSTPEFFRARLDGMVDPRHLVLVLAGRQPWSQIEQDLAVHFESKARPAGAEIAQDMLGEHEVEFGGGVSPLGRSRLPFRACKTLGTRMNASDFTQWAENVQQQFFSGLYYYEPRLPYDATQIGRFRLLLGEDGIAQLLKATIECAVQVKAVRALDLERVIGLGLEALFFALSVLIKLCRNRPAVACGQTHCRSIDVKTDAVDVSGVRVKVS